MTNPTRCGSALLLCLAITGCGANGPAAHTDAVSHVPNVAQVSVQGAPPASDRELHLQIALPLRNESDLDARLAAALAGNHAAFLTPDEFAQKYHPQQSDVDAVRERLQAAGMQVDATAHGTLLGVTATVAQAEALFKTNLDGYVSPAGEAFIAPVRNVVLPDDVPMRAVHGLTSGLHRKPRMRRGTRLAGGAAPSGPGALSPNEIRTIYNVPATATGKGQSVALVEFDGYDASDIQGYEKAFNIPNVKLTNILLSGADGKIQDEGGAGEVTLDIEFAMAMAPNLDGITVYEAPNSNDNVVAIGLLNELINPTQGESTPAIVSCSWGVDESQVSDADAMTEDGIFKQMVAQGQTFYDASGDGGATDQGQQVVDDYAGNPYVVGVGGTSLTLSSGGAYKSETTWFGTDPKTKQPFGSGGGISTRWQIPAWQMGQTSTAAKASATMRNVPDVSLDADPDTGYVMYYEGSLQAGTGGTSCAAPLWAGFHALVDEQRKANGKPALGFMAPALSAVAAGPNYATNFHDVADNSTNGVFPAVPKLDDATGWGSFNGATLLASLAGSGGSGTSTGTASTGGSSTGGTAGMGATSKGSTGGTGATTASGMGTGGMGTGSSTGAAAASTAGAASTTSTGGSSTTTGTSASSGNGTLSSCNNTGFDGALVALISGLYLLKRRRRSVQTAS